MRSNNTKVHNTLIKNNIRVSAEFKCTLLQSFINNIHYTHIQE